MRLYILKITEMFTDELINVLDLLQSNGVCGTMDAATVKQEQVHPENCWSWVMDKEYSVGSYLKCIEWHTVHTQSPF